MEYILVTDVGTTAIKTSLFDTQLNRVGDACLVEYDVVTKSDGFIELDAEIYWRSFREGLFKVCESCGAAAKDISRLVITSQGETLIPVDGERRALANAIVWLDSRASQEAELLRKTVDEDEFFKKTGIPDINATCPICKLLWIKANQPELYEKTGFFLMVEDFLIMKLTGRFVSEKSMVTTTGYYDIYDDRLWTELMDELGLDSRKVPEILNCGDTVGSVLKPVADELGLSASARVIAGAMDQVSSVIGAGNVESGDVTEATGTCMVVAVTTDRQSLLADEHITIYRHAFKDRYLILPLCMTGGILLKWFKDEFCSEVKLDAEKAGISPYEIFDRLVESSPPLANGIVTYPYFNGSIQPQFNPDARGVFFGIGLDNTKADFLRSVFESVGYMLQENIELIFEQYGVRPTLLRCCGGGSKSDVWLKIKADITGLRTCAMLHEETTSIGAAALSLLSDCGEREIISLLKRANPVAKEFEPDADMVELYKKGYEKYTVLCKAVDRLF